MPPSIPAALVVRRGTQGLSLPQLSVLLDNPAEVEKILKHIETERTALQAAKTAAEEVIVKAERRQNDLAEKDAALETRTAELEGVHAERMGEVAQAESHLDEDRRQHDKLVEQHRATAADNAHSLRQKAAALNVRRASLDAGSEALANRNAELDEWQRRIEQQAADLSQERSALEAQRARIGAGIDRMREALEPAEETGT